MFLIHHARMLLSHPLAGITISFTPVAFATMLAYTHELLFVTTTPTATAQLIKLPLTTLIFRMIDGII